MFRRIANWKWMLAVVASLSLLSSDATVRFTERTRTVMGYYCAFSHSETQGGPAALLLLSMGMASRTTPKEPRAEPTKESTSACTRNPGAPAPAGATASERAGAPFASAAPRT